MKRGYSSLEYRSIVRRLRKACPAISISSDFIVGFPGESDADFDDTMTTVYRFTVASMLIIVPLIILVMTMILWTFKSSWGFLKSLVVAFLLFNVFVVSVVLIWAFISFEVVVGLFWFMVKAFTFALIFVWMRGTLPRVRIDQLMGFAWKFMFPVAVVNLLVTGLLVALTTK
jgi:K+-sensing histidine kinase KdpD